MKNNTPARAASRDSRSARADALRERLKNFRAGQHTSKIGSTELLALAAAFVLLALTASAYFFYLVPARTRLLALQSERAELQSVLRRASEGADQDASTQATVGGIVESLEKFETEKLEGREEASTAVIEELNRKTRRHGLTRAQFSFTYQDEKTPGQSSPTATATSARRQNIFPGIDISLTVDGAYPSVRRFIRDIEASQRFIVINNVQLEGVNDSGAQRGALVSLRLDMSAFFRRAGITLTQPPTAGGAATH
ncbi:MAG: hypothetical protein H0T45_18605 [Pyrinomonadaceae bacterium]|nr:hypothetical protein [Pyrinomonadaceae bacterium]